MSLPERWLTVDPGEDCGWALWSKNDFLEHGTDKLWTFSDLLWNGHFAYHPSAPETLVAPADQEDLYFAGLFDGEGCISIRKPTDRKKSPSVTLTVAMTVEAPIRWIESYYGGTVRGPLKNTAPNSLPVYRWEAAKQSTVFWVLDRLYPYLLVKAKKAREAFQVLRREDKLLERRTTHLGLIVFEDWRLYPWKLRDGSMDFDECRTARLIGSIYQYARIKQIPIEAQGAKIKEAAVAAGAEALFSHPLHENRHANDATMHGVYRIAKEQAGGTK